MQLVQVPEKIETNQHCGEDWSRYTALGHKLRFFKRWGVSNSVGLATEFTEILRFFSENSVISVAKKVQAHSFRHSQKVESAICDRGYYMFCVVDLLHKCSAAVPGGEDAALSKEFLDFCKKSIGFPAGYGLKLISRVRHVPFWLASVQMVTLALRLCPLGL